MAKRLSSLDMCGQNLIQQTLLLPTSRDFELIYLMRPHHKLFDFWTQGPQRLHTPVWVVCIFLDAGSSKTGRLVRLKICRQRGKGDKFGRNGYKDWKKMSASSKHEADFRECSTSDHSKLILLFSCCGLMMSWWQNVEILHYLKINVCVLKISGPCFWVFFGLFVHVVKHMVCV